MTFARTGKFLENYAIEGPGNIVSVNLIFANK